MDFAKMTDTELHKIKREFSSRSKEFLGARAELNRRAAKNPRNNISLGPKPKLDKRGYEKR